MNLNSSTSAHHKPEIYVVEDNQDIGFILEYVLTEEGFQVKLLSTAAEFKSAFKLALPDIFLLDVMLPDGNGIALCDQIKKDLRSKQLPVLIMSANADITASQACNADEFIPKPFDLSNLIAKIKHHLPAVYLD
ncbi:response regulator transcription factor [Pedobacter sp. N36a]|uniref:response regulator transcription factor n=1 Tax=Pedobacter sp. N36a TaxID=2767996 RepID=UPI0016574143|nr:response regulator transcription factor [Pedobacter sp. N36a]MBC8984941.1 response regulator transcription factor [Pedobacter sp. N36a]